jgi:Cys-tRNA(Pro)/Cys-tRNA(Cys) deacylase
MRESGAMAADVADTPALAALKDASLRYEVVRTERATGAEQSAGFQGIEIHQLLRTIVLRRADNDYLFVLVPGGRAIDWPKLRAHLGVSRLALPDKDEATAVTGYERGAITPFGSTRGWPVIADSSIAGLPRVAIGGGAHGVNLHLAADELISYLKADVSDVTKPAAG